MVLVPCRTVALNRYILFSKQVKWLQRRSSRKQSAQLGWGEDELLLLLLGNVVVVTLCVSSPRRREAAAAASIKEKGGSCFWGRASSCPFSHSWLHLHDLHLWREALKEYGNLFRFVNTWNRRPANQRGEFSAMARLSLLFPIFLAIRPGDSRVTRGISSTHKRLKRSALPWHKFSSSIRWSSAIP